MTDDRALPEPPKQTPIVSNPAVPGVRKPGHKPDSRDATPAGEKR